MDSTDQTNSRTAVEALNVVRRFGDVTALSGVSLTIRQGELFSLLGPSGCGKTTLLRIIAGLDSADSGELRILGRLAADWPAHQRPVNTVFQSYALFPHMTVWDNVAFGLRMKKVPEAELRRRVEHIMDMVDIGGLQKRKPAEISGGQKQRVALARAVVNEPKVLLLDEPLGALDLKLRKQLQRELHQLQRRLGITFVYVTHDQDEALSMSDRIAVMNHGNIEQLDTPQQLYEKPRNRYVAEFLGSCNLIEGAAISKSSEHLELRVDSALGALSVLQVALKDQSLPVSGRVTIAIRPEKVSLSKSASGHSPNEIPGIVEDLQYNGAETHYFIRVGERLLRSCCFNAGTIFRTGDRVFLSLPPESLIILNG